MRKGLLLTITAMGGLSLAGSSHAQIAVQPVARMQNPPEPVAEAAQAGRRAMPKAAEVRAAVKGDPRVAGLTQKLTDAIKIKDKAKRKVALDALGPQILAIRSDVVKKFPPDTTAIDRQLNIVTTSGLSSALQRLDQLTTTKVVTDTTFPSSYTYRKPGDGCPDSGDRWDFDGNKVTVWAASTPIDSDCWAIRAGRQTVVEVPPGMKRMHIQASAIVDLDATAAALGWYAKAVAEWGIRVSSPSGATLDTINVTGTPQPLSVKVITLKSVSAKNVVPNPLPLDISGFADNVQEGDSNSTGSLNLPANIGPNVEVAVWTGGMVDADVSGVATISNEITVKSIKVTFSK